MIRNFFDYLGALARQLWTAITGGLVIASATIYQLSTGKSISKTWGTWALGLMFLGASFNAWRWH